MNTQLRIIVMMYEWARDYAQREGGASRALPELTAEGVAAANKVLDARRDVRNAADAVIRHGLRIPAASRSRSLSMALVRWLPGAGHRDGGHWLKRSVVRQIAGASGDLVSEAEAAGIIAAAVLVLGAKDRITAVARGEGLTIPW